MDKKSSAIMINPRVLLAIYSVMPLSLLFICVDWFVLDGRLQRSLPIDPRIFAWFVLLFMVPHIIASFFSFADKEYYNYYKSRLLRGAQIAVILGLFVPAFTAGTILPVLVFATYTMVHVFMQQSGVSKSLMKNTARLHVYWQWMGIAIATVIYSYLLLPVPWMRQTIQSSTVLVSVCVALACIAYSVLAFDIVRRSKTRLGKYYFISCHSMPILGIFYIVAGYPILALVVPRIIHDLTAYTFYITHDTNRFRAVRSNFIYRVTDKFRLPVYLANPAVSVLLAYTITRFNSATLSILLTCVFFLHYYTESIIWKRDSLHRMEIKFTPFR